MIWLIVTLAVIGHLGIWAAIFNQIHATAFARPKRKFLEKSILMVVFLPLIYLAWIYFPWIGIGLDLDYASQRLPLDNLFFHSEVVGPQSADQPESTAVINTPLNPMTSVQEWLCALNRYQAYLLAYAAICLPVGIGLTARWGYRKSMRQDCKRLISHRSQSIDIRKSITGDMYHGCFAKLLGFIPLNQSHRLQLESYCFQLQISPQFDQLKICHLSDLHLTGYIDREYFEKCFQQIDTFKPDLIVITGDLVDTDDCIDWLPELLGDLVAPLGKFFILGNHDLRVKDQHLYLSQMESLDWVHLDRQPCIINYHGGTICLVGNELPWYRGAADLSLPAKKINEELRILLSHSPDQIEWAKQFGFDLMLAGHNHGGQIRFPLIGAVIAPSHYGVKYASGTFEIETMLLHVSRGLSGDKPIRIGCPPEIGMITLKCGPVE